MTMLTDDEIKKALRENPFLSVKTTHETHTVGCLVPLVLCLLPLIGLGWKLL